MSPTQFGRSSFTFSLPSGANVWVTICTLAAIAIGGVVFLAWQFPHSSLLGESENSAAMSSTAALCLLLSGIAMLFLNGVRRRATLILTSALFIVSLCKLLEWGVGFDSGLEQLLSSSQSYAERLSSRSMAFNTAFCFVLCAIGIYLLNLRNSTFNTCIGAMFIGLLLSAVAGLSLYGHLLDIETAYTWGSVSGMAFQTAVGLGLLGVGLAVRGWSCYFGRESDVLSLTRAIRVVAVVGVLLIALMSTMFGIVPLYDLLQTSARNHLYQVLSIKVRTVEEFVRREQAIAQQSAADSGKRKLIESHLGNSIGQAQFGEEMKNVLNTTLKTSDHIVGVSVSVASSTEMLGVGREIPSNLISSDAPRWPTQDHLEVTIAPPFELDGKMYFLTRSPILDNDGRAIATEYIMTSLDTLGELVIQDLGLGRSGKLYLGYSSENAVRVSEIKLQPSGYAELLPPAFDTVTPSNWKLLLAKSSFYDDKRHFPGAEIKVFVPVRNLDWGLIASARSIEIDSLINGRFLRVVFAVGILSLIGAAFLYGIIRTLLIRLSVADESVLASLREKEMLLKEIHHRVKNNLQVINSIFNLQARRTDDERLLKVFRESKGRIQSISLLHETLYRSSDLSRIDVKVYLEELAGSLTESFDTGRDVQLAVRAEDVHLDIDKAISCGLIVNELVTNCFKHAFPTPIPGGSLGNGHGPGKLVNIQVEHVGESELELMVQDNGIGLPDEISVDRAQSLGLRLVNVLCSQLKGTLSISNISGTTYRIRFVDAVTQH